MQKLNRGEPCASERANRQQASDFKLMHPGRKSWKIPYRREALTYWRQIEPPGPGT